MNEMNFDSLKHIKAPQEWLEKAAAIPETAVQKRSAFPLFRVAMAASVVLVSVIGLLVFLFFGGGSAPVAIRESGDSATAVSDTETEDSQAGQSGTKSGGTEPAETIAVLSTDAQGNTVVTYQEKPAASTSVTQPTAGMISPTEPVASTNPRATEKAVPSTELPPAPTDAPDPTTAPPTEPSLIQEPTEEQRPPGDCEVYGMFKLDTVSGSGYSFAEDQGVFCRLYDSSGSLVGDSPLYSPQREATILSRYDDGTVVAYYNPADKGLYLTEDAYEYVFYDVHGNELYRDIKFVF